MKKTLMPLFALSVPFVLSSCGNGVYQPQPNGGAETSPPADTASDNIEVLDVVVLYSNAISDGRGEWIAEQARQIGIDLQLVDAGGVAIANRIIAEQGNPQADVVFGLNQLLWAELVAEGAITPYVPIWANEVPTHLNNPNGYFHAVALVGNLLAYDLAQITPEEAPTDWLDLWHNEEFHGRYTFPNALTGSTVHMILSGIFTRFLDDSGHLGISAEGWGNIAAKFANGVMTNEDIFVEMVNPASEVAMGQIWHMGIAPREAQFNMEAGVVVPEIGIPFSVEGVALINGANNEEAAQRFINWFGSAEVMNGFGIAFDYLPANPAAHSGLSDATLAIAAIPEQHINWDVIAPNMPAWLEHIYLNYLH
ncbi:MAG: extracellular solute-binding protein [Defluviitaleaceae bacterium]|nr:extracellular solute-binding protein [Defluviitaleaceae bacterium]